MDIIKIKLNNLELVSLSLHMNIMRNSIKKGFKKTYDRVTRKSHMEKYDSIADKLGNLIKNSDDLEQETMETLDMDKPETEILYSFLDWYIKTLSVQAKEQNIEVEALRILTGVYEKVKEKTTLMYFQEV